MKACAEHGRDGVDLICKEVEGKTSEEVGHWEGLNMEGKTPEEVGHWEGLII